MKKEIAKIAEGIDVSEFSLEEEKALSIQESFIPKIDEKNGFQKVYSQLITKEITSEVSQQARELRLKLRKVRTSTDKIRKREKDFYLRAGQFIDALAKKIGEPISQMEDNLLEIEEFEKRKEQERLNKLQEKRVKELSPYLEDAEDKVLNEMDEDVWKAYLTTRKDEYEKEQERLRKDREEEERIAKIDDLHRERKDKLIPYWNFLDEEFKEKNFGEVSEKDFNTNFKSAKVAKEKSDKEAEELRQKAARLEKERKDKEEKTKKRNESLKPYMAFIKDYDKVLNMSDADFDKELKSLHKQYELEEERVRKEQEAKEKELEKQRLENQEQEKLKAAPLKEKMKTWVGNFELPEFPGEDNDTTKDIRDKFEGFIEWSNELIEEV